MLTTTLVVGSKILTIIGYGSCLGIGFWCSKKLTDKLDETLFLYDKRNIQKLELAMGLTR